MPSPLLSMQERIDFMSNTLGFNAYSIEPFLNPAHAITRPSPQPLDRVTAQIIDELERILKGQWGSR